MRAFRSLLGGCSIVAAVLICHGLLPGAAAPKRRPASGEKIEQRVFHLKCLSPAGAAETVRRLLNAERGRIKLVPWRPNRLVVEASLENLLRVAAILEPLDTSLPPPPSPSSDIGLEVRVFQVIDGFDYRGASALPDDLGELAAELRKRGIRKPRVATALFISTKANARFSDKQPSCIPDYALVVSGATINTPEQMWLRLSLDLERTLPGCPNPQVDNLRTCLPVVNGRPVVLGMVPVDKVTSVLAVQVRRTYEESKREKRFTFEFREKPWRDVFAWLAEQTGKPFICTCRPTGSFTFVGPKGRQYTIPEVTDIINGKLMAREQPYRLVNRGSSFTIVPADEIPEPGRLPRIKVEDLDKHGKTEWAQVVVSLHSESADELVAPVKERLGPFGDLVVLKSVNMLILGDRVGNLRRLIAAIQYLDRSSR